MSDYNSSYTGPQIDTAVGAALGPDASPTSGSTKLVQSGGVYDAITNRVPVYGMGENLLDNWYFVGGGSQLGGGVFPINQRGQSTYTGAVYGPDRWKGANNQSVMTLVSNGLQLSTTDSSYRVWQQLCSDNTKSMLAGKTGTISVIEDGVLYSATGVFGVRFDAQGAKYTYSVNTSQNEIVRIGGGANGAAVVSAIKVELGSEQTLAHQENGAWVLNEIPNYEEELVRCQISTADKSDTYANKVIATNASNRNLLGNWYFVGGGSQLGGSKFPINFKGLTVYDTNDSYVRDSISGWSNLYINSTWASVLNVDTDGIYFTIADDSKRAGLTFRMSESDFGMVSGKQVTVSILTENGLYYTTLSSFGTMPVDESAYIPLGDFEFTSYSRAFSFCIIYNGHSESGKALTSPKIYAAKAELGSVQTLAHLEGTTWVLNDYPCYEEELIKCQTSTANPNDYLSNKTIIANTTNKNLLDNWYFMQSQVRGGQLPINRRGLTTLSTNKSYFIDRWATFDGAGTVSIGSSGLSLVGTTNYFRFGQQIPMWKIVGRQVTLSVLVGSITSGATLGFLLGDSGGDLVNNYGVNGIEQIAATSAGLYQVTGVPTQRTGTTANDLANCLLRITQGGTAVVKAVKVEYGSQQTLAHQENGQWVLNEIPDYNEELVKCKTNNGTNDTYAKKSLATEQQLAYVESGTTASRAYAVGEYFCWNGLLYRAKTAISSGASFTVGTNCEAVTGGGLNQYVMLVYEGTLPSSGGEVNVQAFIGYKEYHLLDFQYYNSNNSTYGLGSSGFSVPPFLQYTKGNAGVSCRVRFTINSNTAWNSRSYYVTVLAR